MLISFLRLQVSLLVVGRIETYDYANCSNVATQV